MPTLRIPSAVGAMLLLLAGCGPGVYPVEGEIVYEDGGQPFPGGHIELELEHADPLKRTNASADIEADGRFKLLAGEGKYRVLLLPPMPPVTAKKRRPLTPYNDKYRTYENSGLSIEVTRDASKNKVKLQVSK